MSWVNINADEAEIEEETSLVEHVKNLERDVKRLVEDKKEAEVDREKLAKQVEKLVQQVEKLVEDKKKVDVEREKLAQQVEELGKSKDWGENPKMIVSVQSGKCLNVSTSYHNGANVQVWSETPKLKNNMWEIVPAYGFKNKVGIMSLYSNKFLNVAGGGVRNGTNVQVHGNSPLDSSTHNLWKIITIQGSANHFHIQSVHNNKFLNLCGGRLADGTNIETWEGIADLNSVWKIVEL